MKMDLKCSAKQKKKKHKATSAFISSFKLDKTKLPYLGMHTELYHLRGKIWMLITIQVRRRGGKQAHTKSSEMVAMFYFLIWAMIIWLFTL